MNLIKSVRQGITQLDNVTFSNQGASPVDYNSVKTWLRREGVTEENLQIDELINGVLDEFMRITNRSLISQDITAVYTSYGREITLPYGPVTTLTSVKTNSEGTKTAVPSDNYYLIGDTLHMKELKNAGLEVVYNSAGSFPDGLTIAVYQAVLTNYNDREDNVLGGVTKIPNNSRKKALRYKRY